MSKTYNLIFCENGKLIPREEALEYMKSIQEKIILIGLISTTQEGQSYSDSIKLSLLTNLVNTGELSQNFFPQSISVYPTSLEKQNFNSKIFVLDINISNNKHLFSLCFLICSLFVFCFDQNLNNKELNKFQVINSLIDTLKLKNKNFEQKIFS